MAWGGKARAGVQCTSCDSDVHGAWFASIWVRGADRARRLAREIERATRNRRCRARPHPRAPAPQQPPPRNPIPSSSPPAPRSSRCAAGGGVRVRRTARSTVPQDSCLSAAHATTPCCSHVDGAERTSATVCPPPQDGCYIETGLLNRILLFCNPVVVNKGGCRIELSLKLQARKAYRISFESELLSWTVHRRPTITEASSPKTRGGCLYGLMSVNGVNASSGSVRQARKSRSTQLKPCSLPRTQLSSTAKAECIVSERPDSPLLNARSAFRAIAQSFVSYARLARPQTRVRRTA
ncbi:hypothetical protein B0H15DRAFT_338746 [Mycena belliarum]|uniref:Uncharacterized protein n=1 Tax=Mycena belliarum TaxID=1033014 RepID=A0AAD6UIQ3_9AGAR|nr:hypothetical protein B0H15DRAFT_338746 [Mycena belliae]